MKKIYAINCGFPLILMMMFRTPKRHKGYWAAFVAVILLSACAILKSKEEKPPVVIERPVIKPKPDSVVYQPLKKDSFVTITLSAVGDLMSHEPQVNNARIGDNKFDFRPSFAEVKPYLSAADLTMGNLETTCAGKGKPYKGYPAFNTPDEYVEALKDAGFDLLLTSNNHSMDTGEDGLQRTISIIKKNKLAYTGTFTSQHDRDSVRIFTLKGIKLGVLNYTYGTNGSYPVEEHKYMLNVIDTVLLKNDIALARKAGAEIVLVFYHYGIENKSDPTDDQKFAVGKAVEYGADIVLGAHAHVLSPVGWFQTKNAKVDTGFVAWGMGNFLSNQYWRYADAGVIVNLSLTKSVTKNTIRISSASYLPTWVYRGTNSSRKMHVVYPAQYCEKDSIGPHIDAELKTKMKEAFEDTKGMMGKYTNRIQLVKLSPP